MDGLIELWREALATVVGFIMYLGMKIRELDVKSKILVGVGSAVAVFLLLRLFVG